MDYSNAYKSVKDSIVNVVYQQGTSSYSTGTGVLIDDGSKILTCAHCVSTSQQNLIFDRTTQKAIPVSIVFYGNPNIDVQDIAILQASSKLGNGLPIIRSVNMEIGNEVFTVGFPYTFTSEKTLTSGNIAAFEGGLIKIDTSVNNGNSGGPLFNRNGEIIGIVNAKLGSLSEFLDSVERAQTNITISMGGIDAIKTIKQMLREMKRNLNLGIGYAVPTDTIANNIPLIKSIII